METTSEDYKFETPGKKGGSDNLYKSTSSNSPPLFKQTWPTLLIQGNFYTVLVIQTSLNEISKSEMLDKTSPGTTANLPSSSSAISTTASHPLCLPAHS